jgi:RNA polymerase sigma-70 factor (family 1)
MMEYRDQSDEMLVNLLRSGDVRAYETIYNRYWQVLFSFGFRQLGNIEESKEIVHDLMLKLWQNREKAHIEKLNTYLLVSIRNAAIKQIKSQINLRKYLEHNLMQQVVEHFDAHSIDSNSDLNRAIERVMQHMPEKTAQIFKLSKIEQRPVKEIAVCMELSEKAVEYHITKSLKFLREHLQAFQHPN